MFRIIFGLTLSTICGLSIYAAYASFGANNISQSQLGGMILRSLVLNGVPGLLLGYSGGQSLKSKKVLKASLKMLQDDDSIDVDKISSLTGRNKSKAIKDIIRGQKKGIIPNNIEIIISSKIVENKYLGQEHTSLDDDKLIKAKQSLKENIKDKKKVGIQFLATILSLFIIRFLFFPESLYRFFYFFYMIKSSVILAIPIGICNLLRKPLLKLLSLPVNNYTNYSLTIFYLAIIISVYQFFRGAVIVWSLSDLFFIICFPLINIFIYQLIGNYFASDKKFSLNEIVYIFKHTSQELANKTLGK